MFVQVDEDWVKENIKLKDDEVFSYTLDGMDSEIWIIDSNGEKLKNFHQMKQELPQNWKAEHDLNHTYNYDDGYIDVERFGIIKIKSVNFLYDIETGTNEIVINGQETAKAILKDALTKEIKFFDKDGNIK